jgi:glycosyltransferase involved in cell wall biosynthesis
MKEPLIHHKFIILVPFRNIEEFIIDCINSILVQQYSHYEVYLLDDDSDDDSYEQIKEFVEGSSNFHYFRNNFRIGALANLHQGLTTINIDENDIIVILDGDDQLFGEFTLELVNHTYNDKITTLTYGQFIDSYGVTSNLSAYTEDEFKILRKSPWKATHLKTFKYSLFKILLEKDPSCNILKDNDGQFYPSTYDMALMFPLMEIAGYTKCTFIPNILYCYRLHSENDHSRPEGRKLQIETEFKIRSRIPM